ncbi:MAG: hypothetical protein MK212_11010 [Saprospiraceae bacterium]|nr:hypothetical protein [Saprospiraceae bacterium]
MKLSITLLACILLMLPSSSELQAQQGQDPNRDAIAQLSRKEKNTMTVCPLYGTRMKLNENYRANATDFRDCYNYPFAQQLHYRRYCPKCTKALHQEEKRFEREERAGQGKATMERCELYGDFMKTNPEFSSVNSVPDSERDKDMINAKQYKGRLYCKICSKLYSDRQKEKEKEENKK